MHGAAVLDDAHAARGELILDAVFQKDHAIGDRLFEALRRKMSVAASARNDGGKAMVFEPAEQAAQFGAKDGGIVNSREQTFDRIEDNAFCAHGFDGVCKPNEYAIEIEFAGFLDFVAAYLDVIDRQFTLFNKDIDIGAQ